MRFAVCFWLCLALGCARASSGERPAAEGAGPGGSAGASGEGQGQAGTGAAAAAGAGTAGKKLQGACFVMYSGCELAPGLPATSPDGQVVAVLDRGPVSEREEILATMRMLRVGGGEVSAMPLLADADYESGVDPMTGEMSSALQRELDARLAAAERALAGYVPMTRLGIVAKGVAGQAVSGMRAEYEGGVVQVVNAETGAVLWKRAIGEDGSSGAAGHGEACANLPVAEVEVWVSMEQGVAVARMSYVGAHHCASEGRYVIWRR